jgi:hypothetical protein
VERALDAHGDVEYNDIAQWEYARLPEAFGCKGWTCAKAGTLTELDAALEKVARGGGGGGFYIEVLGGRNDFPKGLQLAHGRLAQIYGNVSSDEGGMSRATAGQARAGAMKAAAGAAQRAPPGSSEQA